MGGGRNKKRKHAQLEVSLVYDKCKDPKMFFVVNTRDAFTDMFEISSADGCLYYRAIIYAA